MTRIIQLVKNEFAGWKRWQIIWMIIANIAIIGASIYMKDSFLAVASSVTGTICVILCGLGRLSNYAIGIIHVILYAVVAWNAKYYGGVMLNLLYALPANIAGWIMWAKHMDKESNEVVKKRLKWWQDLILLGVCAVGVFGYGCILKLLGGNLPFADSVSTVLTVIAQILMIRRFAEQWAMWIIVDAVNFGMWIAAFYNGGESIATLLMWAVYLVNAIIMFIKWIRDSGQQSSDKTV